MICVVIKGLNFQETREQIAKALRYADLVELRLDYWISLDIEAVKNLRDEFSIPMIFTLRSESLGGSCKLPEDKRLATIKSLLTCQPDYFDLECSISPRFIEEAMSSYPAIKLILSYHNFAETPGNLDEIYQEMQKIPASFYKIAVTAKNSLDAMRLLCWAKKANGTLIAISMGSYGQMSRILAPLMGCPITYAALDEDQKTAPGQLSAKVLIEQYHCRSLTPLTKIYGLIGDPVELSMSNKTHNSLMAACGLDAVYMKMQVRPSELADFLQFAKQLPFQGLSVTMPLKEAILPFLDHIDPQALDMGAVNTLVFEQGQISGFNTDGIGALNAIEKDYLVKGKRIVIIGAGGAAKAIAHEAHRRGGILTIINQTTEKAIQLAERFEGRGKGLDGLATCVKEGYDILINCTPVSMPIHPDDILPQVVVMDIKSVPKETTFLQCAKEKGCTMIYGYEMFIEQALGQFRLWFKNQLDSRKSRQILEEVVITFI